MRTSDFNYDLPPELIAQEPLAERSQSRMMVVHGDTGALEHRRVSDLPEYLLPGDLLVVNDTRVIPARLFGRRADTGGKVEILLLEEVGPREWEALLKTSGRPPPGTLFRLADGEFTVEITARKESGRVWLRFAGSQPVSELLDQAGFPPVPPYIRRSRDDRGRATMDRERYQTVFAREPGAVAAPTAGLHFSAELLTALDRRGVTRTAVTLHVGPGTFKPVTAERVEDHVMESERYSLGAQAAECIRAARAAGNRVVAVGSTSVRTLETVIGEHGDIVPCSGRTALFIRPPFRFQVADGMLTNFHLPMSTLLLMVCAFADRTEEGDAGRGRELILHAYAEAIRRHYRFYSYGDCMLIIKGGNRRV